MGSPYYIEGFSNMVALKASEINGDSPEGEIVNKIINFLCENDLRTYECIAILERCSLEIIKWAKTKKR